MNAMTDDTTPDGVSIGEVWRGMQDMRRDMAGLHNDLKALPGQLATELDARSSARTDTLRAEIVLKIENLELKWKPWQDKVDRMWAVMWSGIGVVILAVVTAVLALVIK